MSTTLILLLNRIKLRQTASANLIQNLKGIPLAFYGMLVAHLGIGVFVIGVTLVKGFESEQDLRMEVNDVAKIGALSFKFEGAQEIAGPNYISSQGTFSVSSSGKEITVLKPEKRFYPVQGAMMTEADIEPGVLKDMYVSLGEPLENGAWSVRIYIKPFVRWIWAGCILMALGGIVALSDRRYRMMNKNAAKETHAAQETFEA
jgi:cytochrome c-type biogenesis protein CcmF